jgi:hypothetical protein
MHVAASSSRSPARHTTWLRGLALTGVVAGAWALTSGHAQARDDVYWSIGVQSPGVVIGVSNAPPVVVHQAYPIYQPRPVVIQHVPVVVHQPYPYGYGYVRPIAVAPAPSYHPGRGYGPRWDDRGHKGRHKGQHKRHDGGGWHRH